MNPTKNPIALRSKQTITDALLNLMTQIPYDEITVKQILLETDLSRKTFYRNFSSKDDVLNAYIDTALQTYTDTLLENETYSLLEILDIVFDFCESYQRLLYILRDNDLLYLFLPKLNSKILAGHFKANTSASAVQDDFRSHSMPEYVISFNIGGVWNIIVRWIENNMRDPANDIKKAMVCYLSNIIQIDLRNI